MNGTDGPSIDNSVNGLDNIIISETNKNNNAITPKDPDSQDNNTPSDNLSQGSSSDTGSPTRSPFIRKYGENNFMPSREVIDYITIAGINTSDIPQDISNKISNIMSNLNELCSNSKPSGDHCNTFMTNMQDIFNLEVDAAKTLRGKIRKDTALGIVEKQQFRDIWGAYVLDKAKKKDCMCYLCGLPIVENAPPEMEHKIPSPVMFTTIMHYRQMTMFYAEDPSDESNNKDSVYTKWHSFINNSANHDSLLSLYKLINGSSNVYPKDDIDDSFNKIFEAFLQTIPYIKDKDKGDFFKYLIKYWLLEFAYSHYICNRAKSDLPLCHEKDKYYNAFSTSVEKRVGTYNTTTDNNLKQEGHMIRNDVVNNIKTRKERTCAMFEDMKKTRDLALNEYTTISQVFDDSCNGYQKMISVIVVRSMLALLHRNKVNIEQGATSSKVLGTDIMMASDTETESETGPKPKQARMDDMNKPIPKNIIEDKPKTIDELETEINNLKTEINNLKAVPITRSGKGHLQTKETELQEKQAALEELIIKKDGEKTNDDEDVSLMNTIKTTLQAISRSCIISGGKRRKTRRRRMGKRSRVRRSSRSGSKKTRKRKARKTARKRRSK